MYKSYFERNVNPTNLALFIDSYVRRTDLNIHREMDPLKKKNCTLSMPVINITGSMSPHMEDTVTFNGRLDPTNSSWMKVSYCNIYLFNLYSLRHLILFFIHINLCTKYNTKLYLSLLYINLYLQYVY